MKICVYIYAKAKFNVYFNINSALAVNQPHVKVPYSQLKPNNIVGLPHGFKLQHPSLLRQQDLEVIYPLLPSIKFVGTYFLYKPSLYIIILLCVYAIVDSCIQMLCFMIMVCVIVNIYQMYLLHKVNSNKNIHMPAAVYQIHQAIAHVQMIL